jgi:low affinity Fe/Cu permease
MRAMFPPSMRPKSRLGRWLEHLSRVVTAWTGSSWAFAIAAAVIVVWLVSGPMFHFSDTWQLVINTGTTIVTFLMVFLIQRAHGEEGGRPSALALDRGGGGASQAQAR